MGVLESMKIESEGSGKILLSGKRSHFICSADFSFPEKWDGLWVLDTKLLDYLALKAGGRWLSRETLKKTEYYGHKAVFVFENAVLTLFVPEERAGLVAVLELPEADDIEVEFGVDMRSKSENVHYREYQISGSGRTTVFSSEIETLFFQSSAFLDEQFNGYKIHTDGKQRCFVFSGKTHEKRLVLQFLNSPGTLDWATELKAREILYESLVSRFSSPDKRMEISVRWAILSMEMSLKRTDKGIEMFAGFPWFLETWGRDAGWSIPALIDIGEHEKAKAVLETLLKYTDNGRVPNRLKPLDYNSADAPLLLVIAFAHYIRFSKDMDFLEKHMEKIKQIIDYVRSLDIDADGFPEVESGSWMDTIERRGELIEIDALWIKALEDYYYLSKLTGGYHNSAHISELKKRFYERFFKKTIPDRIEPEHDEIRPNMLVPAYLGILEKGLKDTVARRASNLLSRNGLVQSLSWIEFAYSPESYHNGQAWGLTTLWLASLYPEKWNDVFDDWKKDGLGHFGESWNPETAKLMGCFAQTWTAALVIRHFYEFVAGIRCSESGISANARKLMQIITRCRDWVNLSITGQSFEASPARSPEKWDGEYSPRNDFILSYFPDS